ncbi:MAG: tripartite tricarboxylate transporter TctB family protein [Deltaproteobacteria bacterium]|nr:tripartite tricarboxylate transporter TctB family protein [Deltaproteobacteria bacterium]
MSQPAAPEISPPPPGRVRAPQDLLAGGSLVALSAFALWAGRELPGGRLGAIGAGFLPRVLATLVGVCGLWLVAFAFLRRGDPLARWSLRPALFVCLGVVGFALTIRSPGLAVAGPLVVLVSGAASPETRARELLLFAAVLTAACTVLFRFLLHLPIPILRLGGWVNL